MAVTDHDTTASVADAQNRAREYGIEVVPGIEITAVENGRDVHMLAYFMRVADAGFQEFLGRQRTERIARIEAIGKRLAELGVPVKLEGALALARMQSSVSVGRPQVARAMITAGHVRDMHEAFDRWLGTGRPGFVARSGPAPEQVIEIVHAAGGLVSIAHPGRTQIDERLAPLKGAGLDALEVYHSDHDAAAVTKYAAVARDLGLLVTGGSDFHDPASGLRPGAVSLPEADWQRLRERATQGA